MIYRILLLLLMAPISLSAAAKEPKKTAPLTHPLLKNIDGVEGEMDAYKIHEMIWLINEIKHIHTGYYRMNKNGELDPKWPESKQFIFRGKKQTIKDLAELEANVDKFSAAEKTEFAAVFQLAKDYFDKVNGLLAPEAQGTHPFMFKLAQEFCEKKHRPDSLLLAWNKGEEVELYRKTVTNFKIFQRFTTDLMLFLADIVVSCPKAYKAYKESNLAHAKQK